MQRCWYGLSVGYSKHLENESKSFRELPCVPEKSSLSNRDVIIKVEECENDDTFAETRSGTSKSRYTSSTDVNNKDIVTSISQKTFALLSTH